MDTASTEVRFVSKQDVTIQTESATESVAKFQLLSKIAGSQILHSSHVPSARSILLSLSYGEYQELIRPIHTSYRAHAVPLPCPALIHTCHAAPLPCSDSAVSFVNVSVVAGNNRTPSPTA